MTSVRYSVTDVTSRTMVELIEKAVESRYLARCRNGVDKILIERNSRAKTHAITAQRPCIPL
jgi:hypothetical protein